MKEYSQSTLREEFFKPVEQALESAENTRKCAGLDDFSFIQTWVLRALEMVESGRGWLQKVRSILNSSISISASFRTLRSERRLSMLEEVNNSVISQNDAIADDPFRSHRELDNFAIYAADGHYQACSAHEEPNQGKKRPTGHFFAADLRTHSMHHLDVARPDTMRKKKGEHDMHVLKRLDPEKLRMQEPKGRKVIIAYDPAGIDFIQWRKWKKSKGIYIISQKKKNMALAIIGEPEFDTADARNNGVESDQFVASSNGVSLRCIKYTDPATGKTYNFITNEMTLPPGLLAYIYKRRWDIEKIFDEMKNKLHEKKAWSKNPTAQCQQAIVQCLCHNLMLILEHKIEREEGIYEEKSRHKMKQRVQQEIRQARDAGRPENPLPVKVHRATQRSLQFIRWLRDGIALQTSWRRAVTQIGPLMQKYLT